MKMTIFTGIALAAGLAHAGTPSSLILDDFDSIGGDDAAGTRLVMSSIFDPLGQGGEFYVDNTFVSGSDTGALIFNSGFGAQQSGGLDYEPGSLDLSAYNAIELDFLGADQSFDMWILLSDNGGDTAFGTFQIDAGGERTEIFEFTHFIALSFDWSDIDTIEIEFNNGDRVSSLDFIATELRATVPAPSTLAMLGLGGLVATRRRR